jgi:pimeloyl-ACP methyl ester carboxylesterase
VAALRGVAHTLTAAVPDTPHPSLVLSHPGLAAAALLPGSKPPAGLRADPPPFAPEPVTLVAAGGTLHGELLAPGDGARVPAVLIHPGSGPTDRDGNSTLLPGRNDALRLLAVGLASRGVASLRIDKRGIGASAAAAGAEADLRIETYATDAAGWLRQLRADHRFDAVVALGHSEGALIAALAAGEAGADGYVALAGAARRGSDVLRRQLRDKLSPALAARSDRILAALERGETVEAVPAPLMPLYRPSVQPYLVSWFRHVPSEVVARLAMPVLIVQGTTDLQLDTTEAGALLAARPGARLLQIRGMNHVLKHASGGLQEQLPSYGDPALPVVPELIDGVAAFAHELRARSGDGRSH